MEIKIPSLIISQPQLNKRLSNYGFRNLLFNGDFEISEIENSWSGDSGVCVEGWQWSGNARLNRLPIPLSSVKDVGGCGYYLDITSSGSSVLFQKLEGSMSKICGRKITASFWYKANYDLSDMCYLRLTSSINGTLTTETIHSFLPTQTNAWQRVEASYTVNVPTLSTVNDSDFYRFELVVPEGNMQITGIQLELGDNATDMEHIPYILAKWIGKAYKQVVDVNIDVSIPETTLTKYIRFDNEMVGDLRVKNYQIDILVGNSALTWRIKDLDNKGLTLEFTDSSYINHLIVSGYIVIEAY